MAASILSTGACAVLVSIACFTDLRWRRIPNYLTFPAIVFGLVTHTSDRGWEGLLLSISGLLLAPCVLYFLHLGRGPGMGDIKLAAALGAILGPPLGVLAILISAIAGGFLAILWVLVGSIRRGQLTSIFDLFTLGKSIKDPTESKRPVGSGTIPYGVALTAGTLITLAAYWWTGLNLWVS